MTSPISAPTALFWGEDGFLLRLAAHELLAQRGFRATELEASDWRGGETSDLATPSLSILFQRVAPGPKLWATIRCQCHSAFE